MKIFIKNSKGFTIIELLIVIGILTILAGIVWTAINPVQQFKKARDTQRRNDVVQLLNWIHEYQSDNSGTLPAAITTSAQNIANTGADICSLLLPKYTVQLPRDPSINNGTPITSCTTYNTGYQVSADTNGHITVLAPNTEIAPSITLSR